MSVVGGANRGETSGKAARGAEEAEAALRVLERRELELRRLEVERDAPADDGHE